MATSRIMDRERQTFVVAPTPRQLSSEAERIAKEMAGELTERRKAIESSTRACPIDGKESSYVGTVGTYQIAVPVYKCPDGHEFSWRSGVGAKLFDNQGATSK